DRIGGREHRLEDHPNGNSRSIRECLCHLLRVLSDLLKSLRAIQMLATSHEPDFKLLEIHHTFLLIGVSLINWTGLQMYLSEGICSELRLTLLSIALSLPIT